MKPVGGIESEAWIGQALYIEKNDRCHQKVVLKWDKEEDFAVAVCCIPARMTEHPGANIKAAEEYEGTQPVC